MWGEQCGLEEDAVTTNVVYLPRTMIVISLEELKDLHNQFIEYTKVFDRETRRYDAHAFRSSKLWERERLMTFNRHLKNHVCNNNIYLSRPISANQDGCATEMCDVSIPASLYRENAM